MNPVLVGLLAGLIGLSLGVAGMLAFVLSEKARRELVEVDEPTLPAGATEVLSVVGRAFMVLDSTDGVVRASPGAYAFGLVRGHTVVHAELPAMAARVRRDGVIEERELELARGPLGQGMLVVRVRAAPLGSDYILLLADDRTEITRTEAVRNDFVANVSHELKTPVGAISLLAEALEDAAGDEEAVRRFARRTHKESARLAALVQDIIELSRLQSADVVRQGAPVDLNTVLAEAVDRNRLTAEARDVTITVGGRIGSAVHGERDLLTTALRNLIDNAIRYSPEGSTVRVRLRSREGLAEIAVTDEGQGISEAEQERIFERFYRVDAARSRQTGGTGRGLSIVRHVLANHGGEVTVSSQPGRGSTFTVRLPEMETGDDDGGRSGDGSGRKPRRDRGSRELGRRDLGRREQGKPGPPGNHEQGVDA